MTRWQRMTPAQRAKSTERTRLWYNNISSERKAAIRERANLYRRSNPAYTIYTMTKARAKRFGIKFNLAPSDISIPELCPALGIRLERGRGRINPNSPSIDRIDPTLGYVKGNVIIISNLANSIKTNATPDQIIKVGMFFKSLIEGQQEAA